MRAPSLLALALVASTFAGARPAAADDPRPVVVTITPKGQPWSVGSHGGQECEPTCTLHLAPDKYAIAVGDAKQEVTIDGPTEITYSRGTPGLRTIGGWMAIGGVGSGGIVTGFAIWGLVKSCGTAAGCPGITVSRTASQVLVTTAAVLISISVTGAIMYAAFDQSITVRSLAPERAPRRTFDVVFNPSSQGATLDFVKRF